MSIVICIACHRETPLPRLKTSTSRTKMSWGRFEMCWIPVPDLGRRQRIPCHRARNREGPTTKCGAPVTRNNQLMTAGRAEVLTAGNISDQCTCSDQIRRCLVLQTSVDGRAEFVLDALRNIEPVELSMQQVGQATVVLASVADEASRSVKYSVHVCVNMSRNESMLPTHMRPILTLAA